MFKDIGSNPLAYASTILFCISFILVIAVYVIYWKGPELRRRSPFAQQLSDARAQEHVNGRRLSKVPTGSRANSFARSQQDLRIRQTMGSRRNSFAAARRTPKATPKHTPLPSRAASPVHEEV
jgi:hypothetical protein